jgi:hypothetical protein
MCTLQAYPHRSVGVGIGAIMLAVTLALVTFGDGRSADTALYDETTFSTHGRLFEPVPDGHLPGKDNGPGRGLHHASEDCGMCHKEGGRAEAFLWTMGGTLYRDRLARRPLRGGEVLLEDYAGNVVSMTTNEAGNFWTAVPLASNPWTVSSYHGGPPFVPLYTVDVEGNLLTPAPPEDARTWKYKTWTKKGADVRPMVSMAGVGGSVEVQRMACNMHHGGVGHRSGALWSGRDATLDSYPASRLSYRRHIQPILRSKCAPCHVPARTTSSVGQKSDIETPSTVVDYSSGLDLMFYGGSTVSGIAKAGVSSAVKVAAPSQSELLRKTVQGGPVHAGGKFWSVRDVDYRALSRWIAEGALDN